MSFFKDHFVLDRAADAREADAMFVPTKWAQRRRGGPLCFTAFGWGFLMTGLIAGGTLGSSMPWKDAMLAILIGNAILFVIAVGASMPGYQMGAGNNPMYMFAYGKRGFWLPAVLMIVSIMGWQGMITGMAAAAWAKSTTGTLYVILAIFFGLLFGYTTYRGISGLEKVAVPATIILVAIGIYAVYYNVTKVGGWDAFFQLASEKAAVSATPMTLMAAVSVVVGAWIGGSVLGSELTRFAKQRYIAVSMIVIGIPLCQIGLNFLGAVGGVASGSYDFTAYLGELGMGWWIVSVVALTFALWTSCDVNLYFPASMVSYVFNIPRKGGVLTMGLLGTILAACGIFNYFLGFLNLLGLFIPPLVGPLFADYYINAKGKWDIKLLHKLPACNWAAVLGYIIGTGTQFIYCPGWCPAPIWATFWAFVAALVLSRIFAAAGHPQGYDAVKHLAVEPVMPMEDDSQLGDFDANFVYVDTKTGEAIEHKVG